MNKSASKTRCYSYWQTIHQMSAESHQTECKRQETASDVTAHEIAQRQEMYQETNWAYAELQKHLDCDNECKVESEEA